MKSLSFVALLCVLSLAIGCKQSSSPVASDQGESPDAGLDEHDHGNESATDHSVEGHGHGAGPHGGTIADWGGGKYHVELTVDHENQKVIAYVLGSDEKTPTPIDPETIELSITDPEMQLTLAADPQEDDPDGASSRYVGIHEKLGVVQGYAGTLTGLVEGTPYSGDFNEDSHDDHDD